jgi:hypothetical protein
LPCATSDSRWLPRNHSESGLGNPQDPKRPVFKRSPYLDGHNQLPKLVLGAKFSDGLEVIGASDRQPKAAA